MQIDIIYKVEQCVCYIYTNAKFRLISVANSATRSSHFLGIDEHAAARFWIKGTIKEMLTSTRARSARHFCKR